MAWTPISDVPETWTPVSGAGAIWIDPLATVLVTAAGELVITQAQEAIGLSSATAPTDWEPA